MTTRKPSFSEIISVFTQAFQSLKKNSSKNHAELEQIDHQIDLTEQKTQEPTSVRISRTSMRNFWLYGLGIVLFGVALFFLRDLIYLFGIAFILAVATETFIGFFAKRMPRIVSIMVSYLLVIIFLLSGVLVLIPFVAQQSTEIWTMVVDEVTVLQQQIKQDGIDQFIADTRLPTTAKVSLIKLINQNDIKETLQNGIINNASQIASLSTNYLGNAGGRVVWFLWGFFKILAQIGIVFIVAVFMSLEKEQVIHVIASFTGNSSMAKLKIQKLYKKLWYWLEGQLFLSLYIFAMVYGGLWILAWIGIDLPNKFTLALIAGLLEFLPYIWPLIAGFAGILVALLAFGWKGMFITWIMYGIVQWTENNILIPAIMSKTLGISPLLILLCAITWVSLFGIIGVLLAVPIAVIVTILWEDLIEK
jgi:predicted PurR-regulated permease PerM